MKRSTNFALIICIALSVVTVGIGFLPSDAFAKNLSGAEIRKLYKGNSFKYTGPTTGIIRYKSSRVIADDNKFGKLKGKWWIDGNKYCREWAAGPIKCGKVKSNRDGSYSNLGYKLKKQ